MAKKEFQPVSTMKIDDLDTLKVLSDPFRIQILEMLSPQPQSVNELAEKMGLAPSKLYYHVNMLEKHGLIQVVDTTQHGNIIEKHYWVTALNIRLDENLCCFKQPEDMDEVIDVMVVPIDATRQDIVRSMDARRFALDHGAEEHPRQVMIYRDVSNLSDAQANEFIRRLRALTEEYEAASDQDQGDDVQMHALTIAFYPSFHYEDPDKNEEI